MGCLAVRTESPDMTAPAVNRVLSHGRAKTHGRLRGTPEQTLAFLRIREELDLASALPSNDA